MKKRKTGIIWAIVAVVLAAAAVTLAIVYKNEVLECISSAKEKFERKKYARICRKEYEDYADVE